MAVKSENRNLKKIFNFLDSRLIIDKSVDFLLIFIGLLAALTIENSIEEKKNENRYVDSLISLHCEIETNLLLLEGNLESRSSYITIWKEIHEIVSSQEYNSYSGLVNIYNAQPNVYESKSFNTIDYSGFLNKQLLGDLIHLNGIQNHLTNSMMELETILQKLYSVYFDLKFKTLYVANADMVESFVSYNYNYNKFEKQLFLRVIGEFQDFKATSERILLAIENELNVLDVEVDESKSYADYYWLANTANDVKNTDGSIEYAIDGLSSIKVELSAMTNEQVSYYGRLHKLLTQNYLIKADSLGLDEFDFLISNSLEEMRKSGVYEFLNIILFLDYYYETKDLDNFILKLQEYKIKEFEIELLSNYFLSWKDFIVKEECLDIVADEYYTREVILLHYLFIEE